MLRARRLGIKRRRDSMRKGEHIRRRRNIQYKGLIAEVSESSNRC